MTWQDLWMMVYARLGDGDVAERICRGLMAVYGAWEWDVPAPRAAQLVIEYLPYKEG